MQAETQGSTCPIICPKPSYFGPKSLYGIPQIHTYICIHVSIYTSSYVYMYIYIYIHTCRYVYMHMYISVSVYVCTQIYMHGPKGLPSPPKPSGSSRREGEYGAESRLIRWICCFIFMLSILGFEKGEVYWGLGFRVQGVGFRVWGSGCGV